MLFNFLAEPPVKIIQTKVIPVKLLPIVAVAAVSTLLLAGCSARPEVKPTETGSTASCVSLKGGDEISNISITGEIGSAPKIAVDGKTAVETSQREVVIKGDGDKTAAGDTVVATLGLYNATTGKAYFEPAFDGTATDSILVDPTQILPAIVAAVGCQTVGSRVAVLSAATDLFGEAGNSDYGIGADDTVLVVADIKDVETQPADRELSGDFDKMPTVTFNADGVSTVTLPTTNPPEELTIEDLVKGDGEKVEDGDSVTVNYQGINWRTGQVFDENFTGTASFATNQVIPGFTEALVGHTVGSRVLAVIPADKGYGDNGNSQAGILGDDTLVFVVEILNTTR